ncbi:zinc metallopeptidase, M23 family [Aliarcobacter faecis]|uniref:M23 family metallopeptidase n=1 Tax=Aliarcobacter faecis TaxID=1564138 RepID=UPI0004B93CCA|nr:M23 family metallopeptidase [Aliarcobacter faecis]QKF74166.1 zinc metallopeptidase, M23 family [Aliarcobacter faecis]
MKFTNKINLNRFSLNQLAIYASLLIVLIVVGFIFLSPTFERNTPVVKFENEIEGKEIYWNFKTPIKVLIAEKSGIQSFKAVFNDGTTNLELESKIEPEDLEKGIYSVELKAPKIAEQIKSTIGTISIEVYDNSKWNFFRGNKTLKTTNLIVDKRSPIINVVSNSYMIKQGGSGVLIVEINDENLKDYYVSFNDQEIFEMFPFHKKNFFISIITWPIDINEFKGVNIIAKDSAGNKSSMRVPFYIQSFKVKIDNLKISDEFVNSVSKNVLELSNETVPDSIVEAFVKANRDLRAKNLKTMRDVTRKNFVNSSEIPFELKTFVRMTNAATFAMFGERRHYFYNEEKIDEAWHLGMDWASTKQANVYTTNAGKVIFKDYLGIYGNSIIIDHGFGVASLYAHTSTQNVEVGDFVNAGTHIANTGSTGAVFGDHLHFGILIQGIEANPNEWLDYNWIKLNLTNTINSAIKIIDGNKNETKNTK